MIAFFDLDRTLLSVNSAKGWIFQEYQEGRMSTKSLGKAMWWLMMYSLRGTGMEEAIDEAALTLQNTNEEEFRQRVNLYWNKQCASTVRKDGYNCVQWHKKQGHHVVLITGSSIYLAQEAAQYFEIPHVLANRFFVEDGVFCGTCQKPLCFGEGKVVLAQQILEQLQCSFSEAFFYTDSFSDVPLLEKVAYPRVIAPDIRLARYAKKQEWPILSWM